MTVTLRFFFVHRAYFKKDAMRDIQHLLGGKSMVRESSWGTMRILRLGNVTRIFHDHVGFVSEWEFTFNDRHVLNKLKLKHPQEMKLLTQHVNCYEEDVEFFTSRPRAWKEHSIDFEVLGT